VKVGIGLSLLLAYHLFPFHQENHLGNKYYPPSPQISWFHVFQTWDTNHYLYVAERGYSTVESRLQLAQAIDQQKRILFYQREQYLQEKSRLSLAQQSAWKNYEAQEQARIYHLEKVERDILNSDAFPPMYPFLIFLLASLFQCSSLVAALLISTGASFGVFWFFFELLKARYDEKTAYFACITWMCSPYAFVFHIAYSESLFLLEVLALFYSLEKGFYKRAGLLLFLLPCFRILGILFVFPYLFYLKKIPFPRSFFYALIPFLGFGFYLLLLYFYTGDPWIWSKAQEGYISKHRWDRFSDLWGGSSRILFTGRPVGLEFNRVFLIV
jgi:hypothetical protein